MPPLKILRFPNPILRRICRPIELVTIEERILLDNMLETMYLNQGVGLAAPQIGVLKRIIVVDVGEGPMQLINPVLTKRAGSEAGEEGCLSLPETLVKVRRAKEINYKALDREGRPIEAEAEGLLARAIQHEIDHLDGRVIIDHANPIKRVLLKARLVKLSKSHQ